MKVCIFIPSEHAHASYLIQAKHPQENPITALSTTLKAKKYSDMS